MTITHIGPHRRDPVNTSWHQQGACLTSGRDPDDWYPASRPGHEPATPHPTTRAALALCNACPVRQACADQGQAEEYGIWGGTTEHQRREARRARLGRTA